MSEFQSFLYRPKWPIAAKGLTYSPQLSNTGRTISMISFKQNLYLENIWKRNPYKKLASNSHSNILSMHASLISYLQKYHRCRQQKPLLDNIWRRNLNKKLFSNSHSNILSMHASLNSYLQEYQRCRQHCERKLL